MWSIHILIGQFAANFHQQESSNQLNMMTGKSNCPIIRSFTASTLDTTDTYCRSSMAEFQMPNLVSRPGLIYR